MLNSSLSESLTNYEQALRNLCECLASISVKQVIQVFNARDRIQTILNENLSVTIEQQQKLIELDNYLVKHSHEVIIQYNLSELRRSLSPPDEAWWWYLAKMFLSVAKEIIRYENALKSLDGFLEKATQNNNNNLSYQIILDVLLIRDRLFLSIRKSQSRSDRNVRKFAKKTNWGAGETEKAKYWFSQARENYAQLEMLEQVQQIEQTIEELR